MKHRYHHFFFSAATTAAAVRRPSGPNPKHVAHSNPSGSPFIPCSRHGASSEKNTLEVCIARAAEGKPAVIKKEAGTLLAAAKCESATGAAGSDDTTAKVWISDFVARDKAKYNRFRYRLSKLNDSWSDRWDEIKAGGTEADAKDFVEVVM